MRIFQIVTLSEYGGAQSVVFNLSQALSANNEVFVLYGGNGDAWKNLNDKVVKIKISEHRKEISWKDILLLFRLFYYRIKYKPDIVHLHSSKIGALGRIAFNPKTIVYTVHGVDSVRKANHKFMFIEKILQKRARKIVGVSQYDVDGLKEEKIEKNVGLVYNGLMDYQSNKKDEIQTSISDKILKIKNSYSKIIMCISRISPQKKFDLFVEIAKVMPELAFVWIGNKKDIANLPENVFCLGEANSAYKYLKYADLFILTTNYEGLPVSILEALSYSVPVVASAVGGIPEILNGKNGFSVDNSIDSFKNKIEYCLHENNIQQMKVAARNSYLEKFTIDRMIEGYETIYKQISEK